ncbi:MAG: sugar transferase [Alteraurantiacibacter sp. bin_em_oilr2.035]|nr:sugar transferase [Alteraurantiacibacter sp. bin_em_oilr2.035]
MAENVNLRIVEPESLDGRTDEAVEPLFFLFGDDISEENARDQRFSRAPENGLARSLATLRLRAYLALLLGDVVIILGSFYAVSVSFFGTLTNIARLESGMLSAYVILPLYLTIALYNGTYSRRSLTDWQFTSFKAIMALALSAALLNLLAFFVKSNADLSRFVFVTGIAMTGLGIVVMRVTAAKLIVRHFGPSPINKLVIHAGGPQFTLPHAYHIRAEQHGLAPDMEDPITLDRLSKYLRNMDEVIVSCEEGQRAAWSEVLKGTGVHGEVVHLLSREIGALGVVHHDDAGISALKVSAGQLGMRARAAKRLFDLAVSGAALVLLAPVMLLTALFIKLEDGGPVFFIQRRMGRGNEFFNILKFRSMRIGDADGNRSASKEDERVTRIGRFIRKTSIDELPQLLNVLRGDMSNHCWTIRFAINRFYVRRRCSLSCLPHCQGMQHDLQAVLVCYHRRACGGYRLRAARSQGALCARPRADSASRLQWFRC